MIHELIYKRRSTVLYSEKTIETETIQKLFEAARWAPSSLNQQPWCFVYAMKGDSSYGELLDCLAAKNQEWAKNAPLLLVTIAQAVSEYKDRKNKYAWHDTALSFANFVFQATSMSLYVHPMGGFDPEKTRDKLAIPDRYEPVIFAAVGYKSDSEDFPEDLIQREKKERIRKPVDELVFHGRFGHEYDILNKN